MHKHHQTNKNAAHAGKHQPVTDVKTAVVVVDSIHNGHLFSEEEIRQRAYQKWLNAGKPDGDGIQFWLDAENELAQGQHQ